MQVDGTGLEVLDAGECLRLLSSQNVGRIALTSGALPVVLPVGYVLHDGCIVIGTRRGTTLASATRHAVVAFEADHFDSVTGQGWSVMVRGTAGALMEPPRLDTVQQAVLARWLHDENGGHVGISLDLISGRRVLAL